MRPRRAARNREAIVSYQQAIGLLQKIGDRYGQAFSLLGLGDTHDAAGDDHNARLTWQQALDMLGGREHPDADRVRARLQQQPAS